MALYKTDANKNLIKISGNATRQLPLGAIFCSAVLLTDSAYKRLDGQCIAIDGVYSQFCAWLISQNTAGNVPTCTIGEYGTELSTCGQCGKFVINRTSAILTENGATIEANSIKLPTVTAFIESSNNTYPIGTTKEAGLPNITGRVDNYTYFPSAEGAFYTETISTSGGASSGSGNYRSRFRMNASRSSAVYGKSETVQPKSVSYPYYIVVATGTKTDVEVDINNVLTEVGNVSKRYLTESWSLEDGTLWYNIYNDGWKECGMLVTVSGGGFNNIEFTLPIEFSTLNYIINATAQGTDSYGHSAYVYQVVAYSSAVNKIKISGQASGGHVYVKCEGY